LTHDLSVLVYSVERIFFTFKEFDMNITILRGNLARDPELRVVNTGGKQTSVVNFTVAVSREYTKASGDKDKVTSFINCEAWDTGAEIIGSSFKKGDLVLVEGSLRNDSWELEGVKHSSLKVRVNNFSKITKLSKQTKNEEAEPVAF
jgi:single-strand DNA-binding protein